MSDIIFPTNPFEDVKPSDFNKLNKKEVTEDFVGENFRLLHWEIYKPFTDTGIDRIIVKSICPDGHTKLDQNLKNKKCNVCGKSPIEITRFIQVKTRKLVNNIFGFTLKSKDIRVDPRHIFLLYSDNTAVNKQDFLVLPVKELLSFFESTTNPFASKSFRTGNNKMNNLKYDPNKDTWSWMGYSWEKYRNINGLKLLQDPQIDLNLTKEVKITRNIANNVQYAFNKGNSYTSEIEELVNRELERKRKLYADKSKILELRNNVDSYLNKICNPETLESSRKYFENVKLTDSLGDDKDE